MYNILRIEVCVLVRARLSVCESAELPLCHPQPRSDISAVSCASRLQPPPPEFADYQEDFSRRDKVSHGSACVCVCFVSADRTRQSG